MPTLTREMRVVLPIGVLVVVNLIVTFAYLMERNRAALQDSILEHSITLGVLHTQKISTMSADIAAYKRRTDDLSASLAAILTEDQYKTNRRLETENADIHSLFLSAADSYENLLDLRDSGGKTSAIEPVFAQILKKLGDRDFSSAKSDLAKMNTLTVQQRLALVPTHVPPTSTPKPAAVNNTPPGNGYAVQTVKSDTGNFTVSMIAGDLATTKIVVDTASDKDCQNDCPVLALADYVTRTGAYAGINGAYFCPASYASCADKKNSFDTLLMNRNKTYFNSENNKYSTVPAVIFGNGFIRFVGKSLEWGRDTSIDSMIANQPLLVSGGSVVFGGDSDPKKSSRGSRCFIANKGNTAYIGIVYNATVAEAATALKALGMDNALNLDSGGSTALWFGGYKAGPGRGIPNAILFVKK
jgi:hypothetical protein